MKRIETGRPASGMNPAQQEVTPGVDSKDREVNAHGVNRYTRIHPGGATKTLGIAQEVIDRLKAEDKHPHWVLANDKGRLTQVKDMGYEHVLDADGKSNVFRTAGGRQQFLMAIPNEWHEDDKKLKKARALASLGKETSIGENEYSPTDNDSAISSEISASPIA